MSEQKSFFGSTPYPHDTPGYTDDETGKEAAEKVKRTLAARQLQVLRQVSFLGPSTADEVCFSLGATHNHIAPRLTELKHMRYVEYTGQKRVTRAGSTAKVLEVSDLGKFALEKKLLGEEE